MAGLRIVRERMRRKAMKLSQLLSGPGWVRLRAALASAALLTGCQTNHHGAAPPLIASPTACGDISISIYFNRRSSRLEGPALALLNAAAQQAHRCRVDSIDVVGLADAPGTPQANAAISEARAKSVTHALTIRGFPAFTFKSPQPGQDAAPPPSDPGSFRRRADVVFHLSPLP